MWNSRHSRKDVGNAGEASVLATSSEELIRQQLELHEKHNVSDMVSSFKDLHSPPSIMGSPRAPSSPRLNVPIQPLTKANENGNSSLLKTSEKHVVPPKKSNIQDNSKPNVEQRRAKRITPQKLQQTKTEKHEKNKNGDDPIIYTHEVQPKSTPRRMKTKLRKRRSKSQSPSAIHRVGRHSLREMEELRRNAMSSLGKHEGNLNIRTRTIMRQTKQNSFSFPS